MSHSPSAAGEARSAERSPLRIAMFVEATFAGVGKHVLDLSASLVAAGHEVHLLYSPLRMDDSFHRRMQEIGGLKTFPLPIHRSIGPADFLSVRAARRYLREHGPFAIVHGHSSKGGAIARIAALGLGARTFYTPNAISTMNPELGKIPRTILGGIERLLSRLGDAIIAVSPEEVQHLKSCGFRERTLHLIPNGIEPPRDVPDRRTAREQLGLPLNERLVGFVGRFAPQKAPDRLVEAFAKLHHSHPDLHLALAGSGDMEAKLREQVARLGLQSRTHFLGYCRGTTAIAAYDVLVLPSRYEGFPYVLLESSAIGTPYVASSGACVTLLAPDPLAHIVIDPTPEHLATAIADALAAPARNASSSRDRRYYVTLDEMASRTEELYYQAVAGLR